MVAESVWLARPQCGSTPFVKSFPEKRKDWIMANIDMANLENMAFVSASEAYERGFVQGREDGINQGIRAFCKLCGLSESPLCDRYFQLILAREYGERMIKNLKEEYKYGKDYRS